ncbi:MAG: diguanylate cyclase [Candidatus Ancillula sp.]|nr:diguanylate cyclase [Candidatus Ancillula sp.]
MESLYDAMSSFEDNFKKGPNPNFGSDVLSIPFGIPAGPLLNSEYCKWGFENGYDVCVYKTVRSSAHSCNSFPNVLSAHPANPQHLSLEEADQGVLADSNFPINLQEINISNSFGVPSQEPEFWIEDVKKALGYAKNNQTLILSFQGTGGCAVGEKLNSEEILLRDIKKTANLAAETGVKIFELNTSCPNEGKDSLLCFDLELVSKVVQVAKTELTSKIPDAKLFIKTAYFEDSNYLNDFVQATHNFVDGYSTINTISTKLVDKNGNNALDENRPTSGVCGAGIKWAGISQIQRLNVIREKQNLNFKLIGVGGVMSAKDFKEYREAGADIVMSATGAMFIPGLANQVRNFIQQESEFE